MKALTSMASALEGVVSSQVTTVSTPSVLYAASLTVLAGEALGEDLLEGVDRLHVYAPRTLLQYWAGMDVEHVPSSVELPVLDTLRVGHVLSLLDELSPRIWKLYYAPRCKRTVAGALYAWLTQLGVALPSPESPSVEKQEIPNVLRGIRRHFEPYNRTAFFKEQRRAAKGDSKRLQQIELNAQAHAERLLRLYAAPLLEAALPKRLAAAAALCASACTSPPGFTPSGASSLATDGTTERVPHSVVRHALSVVSPCTLAPAEAPTSRLSVGGTPSLSPTDEGSTPTIGSCRCGRIDAGVQRQLHQKLASEKQAHAHTFSQLQVARTALASEQDLRRSIDGEIKAEIAKAEAAEQSAAMLRERLARVQRELAEQRDEKSVAARQVANVEMRSRIAAENHRNEIASCLETSEAAGRKLQEVRDELARQRREGNGAAKELAAHRRLLKAEQEKSAQLALEVDRAACACTAQAEVLIRERAAVAELRAALEKSQALASEAASEVHSLRTSLGKLRAACGTHNAASGSAAQATEHRMLSARGLTRSLQSERTQRAAALTEADELRRQVQDMQALGVDLPQKRGCPGRSDPRTSLHRLHSIRVAGSRRCDAFSHEMARQLVEACGMTFEAASTATNLVLTWHLRTPPSADMLVSPDFFAHAFTRLGTLDLAATKLKNESASRSASWGAAADAGNKGREIDMIAISVFPSGSMKPKLELLSAADLHGDGTGKNLANTMLEAAKRHGLHPDGCIQAESDGASACSGVAGETQLFLDALREQAATRPTALVHSAAKETCCIHAKVLEENRGMEAAFPGLALVNFTRLLWECFSTAGALVMSSPDCSPIVIDDEHLVQASTLTSNA